MKHISIFNVVIITAASLSFRGVAQTNSWTKPTSGNWHEAFWSLGVLPAADQTHIMFTNAGWKALAINSVTARDFPGSLNIPRLTVASPTNTMNTLLLNFVGVQSPLRVAESFELGSNTVLLALSSALEVGDNFFIDGTVNQGDLSQVSALSLVVGNTSHGIYNFSNGLVSAGNIVVGHANMGSFLQTGGRLSVSNRLTLGQGDRFTFVEGDGRFELTAGTLTAGIIQVGEPNGRLGPAGADGTFVQSGGSSLTGRLLLGGPSDTTSGNNYTYILNDGLLVTSNTVVYGGDGNFAQSGGLHRVDGALALAGFFGRSFTPFDARYTLSGGVVTAHSLSIDFGAMSQSAGTNQISGDLVIGLTLPFSPRSFYILGGGILSTSNTFVLDSAKGSFRQSGGTHAVGNLLEISGSLGPGYTLSAGKLIAPDIRIGSKSIFAHVGGTISNRGTLTLSGGRWQSATGEHHLGGLKLNASSTNSSLVLDDNATMLRFANSAGISWESAGSLIIHNWRGSTNTGGPHRIVFGTNESGLTAQQLAQIRFRNPAGFAAGDYSATILNTGEIVPLEPTGPGPSISYQASPGQLRLEWPSGYTLQTATNIVGPFEDVNTNSPYVLETTADPQRFFRFRQ